MEKYQIVEVTEAANHAGTKATADVTKIAERLGFKQVKVKMDTSVESVTGKLKRQIGYFRDWSAAEKDIKKDSILLLQHPFHYKQLTRDHVLKKIKQKNVKIISVVHDVEKLRSFRYNQYYEHEFQMMLELADAIIVHNDIMKKWFIEQGVDERKLVSLEIFDYLQEDASNKQIIYEKSIIVAGNLDTEKCGYIKELASLDGVKIHLYGPNFNDELMKTGNVEYHGSFPVDEIPKKLSCGFGLVWDGQSIVGCTGRSGQYLKYNNPHKLSLYLSSGLPVVIWKKAAEADFVAKNGVGILVDSVQEMSDILGKMQITEWKTISENVMKVAKKLISGHYMNAALREALEIIKE